MHLWTINLILSLDIHIQICVPPNIDLICGLVLIFLCGLLSVSDDIDNSLLLQTKIGSSSFLLNNLTFNTAVVTTVGARQNVKWSKI